MLTDHWVIAQLLAQLCSAFLLFGAAYQSLFFIAKWDSSSGGEQQLMLEKKTYLVSSIVQYVLIFQAASLLFFLFTANEHLPNLVKGAMCATGTLSLNPYGYPALYLKVAGVVLYALYLFLHHLDDSEPAYPLTPSKYWLVLPALLLVVADFVLMVLYFANIQPDVIATCCSVVFLQTAQSGFFGTGKPIDPTLFITANLASFSVLMFLLFIKNSKSKGAALLTGSIFIITGIISLKYFFVKYIYGLPSHLCLFDLFLGQYHAIGIPLFLAYFIVGIGLIYSLILQLVSDRLLQRHERLEKNLNIGVGIAAFISLAVPALYWLTWPGSL